MDWNLYKRAICGVVYVTPFVGVWIETFRGRRLWRSGLSHTLRGCVDWNPNCRLNPEKQVPSHPSWVCGLKHEWQRAASNRPGRHTLRGCVDWNKDARDNAYEKVGHTLRGCVDWNRRWQPNKAVSQSHTLRGCVDWNLCFCLFTSIECCHTLRGCVDWNHVKKAKTA